MGAAVRRAPPVSHPRLAPALLGAGRPSRRVVEGPCRRGLPDRRGRAPARRGRRRSSARSGVPRRRAHRGDGGGGRGPGRACARAGLRSRTRPTPFASSSRLRSGQSETRGKKGESRSDRSTRPASSSARNSRCSPVPARPARGPRGAGLRRGRTARARAAGPRRPASEGGLGRPVPRRRTRRSSTRSSCPRDGGVDALRQRHARRACPRGGAGARGAHCRRTAWPSFVEAQHSEGCPRRRRSRASATSFRRDGELARSLGPARRAARHGRAARARARAGSLDGRAGPLQVWRWLPWWAAERVDLPPGSRDA